MAAPVRKIGKYDVLETIGRGGMGVVVKAMDPSLGRVVAIKMMTGGFTGEEFLKRFYREAQSTGNLHHPNIVTVHELGDQEGTPYLVMEFLEGESLEAVISSGREVSILDKINYMVQVCAGLQYAHERHVIHRDIKPANIMLLKGGQIKIVDFGIARMGDDRMTRPGQVMGSIFYMSPEQIHGGKVDARTDIYSAGVALYQLLTYALPFQANDTASTLLRIIQDPVPPLSAHLQNYPPDLDNIIDCALAKDPDDRYATADDFGFDLMRVQAQLRRSLVDGYVDQADRLLETAQFGKARELLLQALKIDPQNRRANDAIRHVQQSVQRQRKNEQARQLCDQAEAAVQQQQFEQALRYIDQAIALDNSEQLLALRHRIEATKIRTDALRDAFRKLQAARAVGNLEAAMEAVELILAIDPENNVANSARTELQQETDNVERQRQVQIFVREARKQISSRKFTDALEVLKKAEEMDPAAPNLRELIQLAAAGREQEQRRKQVARFTGEIQDALNRDDYVNACTLADEALAKFPGEGVLLKLKDLAERQRNATERRAFVEQQMAAARKSLDAGDVAQALAMLEAAAHKYPTDAALQSFLVLVRETAAQQKAESRKAEVRHKAKEALRRRAYEEAIAVLHSGKAELATDDFDDLIQFAQGELDSYSHQLKVDAAASQAQSLIEVQEYDEAIDFLERTLAEVPDEELRLMLADVRRRKDELQQRVNDAAEAANHLTAEERTADAISFLEAQPTVFRDRPELQQALQNARQKHEWLQGITAEQEKIRQALARNDVDSAEVILNAAVAQFGDRQEFAPLRETIHEQRVSVNLALVNKAMREAALLTKFGSFANALEKLESVTAAARYLPPAERAAYMEALADASAAAGRYREDADTSKPDEKPAAAEQAQRPAAAAPNDGETVVQVWSATGTDDATVVAPPSIIHSKSLAVGATADATAARTSLAQPDLPVTGDSVIAPAEQPPLQPAGPRLVSPAVEPGGEERPPGRPATRASEPVRRGAGALWLIPAAVALLVLAAAVGAWLSSAQPANAPVTPSGVITHTVSGAPDHTIIEVGDQICITPQCRIALQPGTYDVKATLPSGAAVIQNITIQSSTPAAIDLDMKRNK